MPADESVSSSSGSNDTPEESNSHGPQVFVYNFSEQTK